MNIYLFISGVLTMLTLLVHSALGEAWIITPLQHSQGLPAIRGGTRITKLTLRFAWHLTSVLGLGIAIILFYFASFNALDSDQITVVKILSLTFLASFIVAFFGSRAMHPSWIVLLLCAILTWLGAH